MLAAPDGEVRAVLEKQVASWNLGDIETFMTTYIDSPELTFSGKEGITRGYQPVLERYRKKYNSSEAMGSLKFSEIEARMLGAEAALVLGRFELTRSAAGGGNASGRFTLVLRNTPKGWKIVHDHTS